MQPDLKKKSIFSLSSLFPSVLTLVVIFLAEMIIILYLTTGLPRRQTIEIAVVDAAVLSLLFLPVLWLLIVRPLYKAALAQKARVDEVRVQSALDWEDTFNTITDMITIHDKEFNIIRANRAAQERLDLSEGGLGKAKCFRHFHGTDCPPGDCPSCKSLATGQPVAAESYEPHLDMYVETRAIPRLNADKQLIGLIHVVRDITTRKRMEASLEAQKRFAENVIENSAVATFVLDPGHKVMIWNKACEALTGIPAEKMIGTDNHWQPFYGRKRPTLADIVVDDSYESLPSLYSRYSRSTLVSNGVHGEGWFLNINGKNRYIVFDASPIYDNDGKLRIVIETLQEIPEHKRLEEELAQSKSKLRTLIEAENDCVTLIAADGTLLEMNPAGLSMIDADALEQVAGKSIYRLILPEHADKVHDLTEKVFQGCGD